MSDHQTPPPRTSPLAILLIFLRLGLTSFGGPIAHLGYYREEFVTRRKWLDEHAYADLVAVCQFLPGPASSQVGFSIGLARGGVLGGLAAWLGFTLPSAILMVLFAYGLAGLEGPAFDGALHGLKIVAVAVVAQAVWGMARSLAPDAPRLVVAAAGAVAALLIGGGTGQIAAITLGALAGLALARRGLIATPAPDASAAPHAPISRPVATALLLLAAALLFLGPAARALGLQSSGLALFDAVYRSGALVFGGGHVVLPLLRDAVVAPGWVSPDAFVAGYGAAQAMPGPLFSFAAFLGAVNAGPPSGWVGAAIALVAIFLPGLLLVAGTLPHWAAIRRIALVRAGMMGVNAAVVGVLAAALYDPVWTSAIKAPLDAGVALAAFLLLTIFKAPPWIVVVLSAGAGVLLG